MAQEVQMPKLGQTMDEGTIENWLKKEGDTVNKGDALFEVTTDKATLEVEAFVSGTLLKILVGAGETVPVNTIVAWVGKPGEEIPETPAAQAEAAPAQTKKAEPAAAKGAAPAVQAAAPVAEAAPIEPSEVKASPRARKLAETQKVPVTVLRGSGPEGRIVEKDIQEYIDAVKEIKVTPVAREIAFQKGIDLRSIKGSGANGKIEKEDVERAAPARPAAARPAAGRLELTAMRRVVAQRMTESKTTVPHFYLNMQVDMTNAMALRKKLIAEKGVKVSYNDIIIKACADSFSVVPRMNAGWGGDHVVIFGSADIGLAVAIDDGLMVPVIRDTTNKDITQIWQDSQALIQKARNKKLGPDDYEGGCMTISNLGMYGIDSFVPIINPGQASILGIGKIEPSAVVRDGGIHIRPMMWLTLCCDHRVVNGAEGAEYIAAVKAALEQ